jgi:hypothetical protein
VSLVEYKAALHASRVLVGLLHEPPFLVDVRPSFREGFPVILVRVRVLDDGVRACLPSRVNSIPVLALVVSQGET